MYTRTVINNKFLDLIFTEYDESLTKGLNIDPLGFQIVWTYFGQKIFQNKTTSVALDIRSYNINLFNHYIIYQIIQEYEDLSFDKLIKNREIKIKEKIEKTLIILENLLTWSWFSKRKEWKDQYQSGLLGTYKAISLWDGMQNYTVNFNERDLQKLEVLKNQRALGVSGRYKGPFRAMGFFKEYEESSYKENSELFEVEIKQLITSQDSPFHDLYYDVIKFLQTAQINRNIEIGMDDTIVNSFVSCFKNPKNSAKVTKEFWKKYLGLKQDESSIIYKHIDLPKKGEEIQNAKQIFEKALDEYSDNKIFQDINQLEPQLTYLNILFDYLIFKSEHKISELDNEFISILENFRWDNLSIDQNSSVYFRVEELKKIKDFESLIEYNKIVMEKRGQTSWIEFKKDTTIKTNIVKNINHNIEDLLSNKLDNNWLNDYYIYSMRSIKRGLEL